MATNMAKLRKFEDGLKLSIWGKIIGFLLYDMDSMVRIAMAIEREIEDTRSIRDAGTSGKRNEGHTSSSLGKKLKASYSDPRAWPDPVGGSKPKPGDARLKPLIKFIYQIHFINRNLSILKSLRKRFQVGASP